MLRLALLAVCSVIALLPPQSAAAKCAGFMLAPDSAGSAAKASCASAHIVVPEGNGAVYRVGPEQTYKNLGDVPWYKLTAGDTVYIHHRSEPYREKILISGRGNAKQWIRILGVPGAGGELPIISGENASTSKNAHFRWSKPDVIEWLGVVHIAVGPDTDANPHPLPPAYIEIANLQVQDGFSDFSFQASNGASIKYSGFAACIYARSVSHLVVRNNVLTNCGQGFYNWTGDGSSQSWWAGLQTNTVVSGNHFYNNGNPGSYLEHQLYTESDGVTIEYNRFGPQRANASGSQIKDRSVGSIIRYNAIEQSREGWSIDLVEPEESRPAIGDKPQAKQTFVYGNTIVSRGVKYPNVVHWNEDHQAGRGRATLADGRLYFYHNTIAIVSDRGGSEPYPIFNATWGAYDCPDPAPLGVIDVRNNIFAVIPANPSITPPPIRLGYCKQEKIELGTNWISPGVLRDGNVTGWEKIVSPASNDPGFTSVDDLRLKDGASAASVAGELAAETTKNAVGTDLSPVQRMVDHDHVGQRTTVGPGSDLGAH